MTRSAFRQTGASLIEVLIAIVIFAFGMLAAAGLQLASLKSAQFASQAAVAGGLAREYGEMMQMFPASVVSTSTGATNSFYVDTSNVVTTNIADCTGAAKTCTAAQLVTSMVQDWSARTRTALPGGRAEVCRDSSPRDGNGMLAWTNCDGAGEMTVIKMGWSSKALSRADAGSTGQGWMTEDRPRFSMSVMGNLKDFAAP